MGSLQLHVLLVACLFGHSDGCNTTYTTDVGEIRSPVVPGTTTYPHYTRCTYTINGSPTMNRIEFTFVAFETESRYDRLTIGRRTFSGSEMNATKVFYPFDERLDIQFRSDESVTRNGFTIGYRLLSCPSESMDCTECSNWCKPDTCDVLNRSCECTTGWTGSLCDEYQDGYYGPDCSSRCSSGFSDVCDKETGRCTCSPGWTGSQCEVCRAGYYGHSCFSRCSSRCSNVCNRETGTCTCTSSQWAEPTCEECSDGYYGLYCSSRCRSGCSDVCSKDTGRCTCRPGWTGVNCDTECSDGYYGQNCSSPCSSGCSDVCSKDTGRCTCRPGWTGRDCDSACPSASYDSYCTKSCSPGCVDGSCNKEDGSCSCRAGFTGTKCSLSTVNVKLIGAAAGGSAGFLLPVSAVVLVICCYLRRTTRKSDLRGKSDTVDDIQLQNVQVPQQEDQVGNVYSNFEEAIYHIPIEEASSHKYSTGQKSDADESVPHASNSMDNHVVHVSKDIVKRCGNASGTTTNKARKVRSSDKKKEIDRPEFYVSNDKVDEIDYIHAITVDKFTKQITNSDSEECYENLQCIQEEEEEIPYENFTVPSASVQK